MEILDIQYSFWYILLRSVLGHISGFSEYIRRQIRRKLPRMPGKTIDYQFAVWYTDHLCNHSGFVRVTFPKDSNFKT